LLDKKITKMNSPTTLSLPFSTKYGVRKKAPTKKLIENILQVQSETNVPS
jgi:hypothetical protein